MTALDPFSPDYVYGGSPDSEAGEGARQVALVWLSRALRALNCYDTMLARDARELRAKVLTLHRSLSAGPVHSSDAAAHHCANINAVQLTAPTAPVYMPGVDADETAAYASMFQLLGMAENAMSLLALVLKYRDFEWPWTEQTHGWAHESGAIDD